MTNLILTVLISILAGAAIGAALTRKVHPESKQRRELEGKLKAIEDDYKAYQQEVAQHFVKSSELINKLTQSYRDVHEHMAVSAINLANPEISRKLLDAGSGRLAMPLQPDRAGLVENPNPPKDYAPKVPGGILSEEYGLKEETGFHIPASTRVANDFPETEEETDENEDPTLKVG